jgi:hypothetical protein
MDPNLKIRYVAVYHTLSFLVNKMRAMNTEVYDLGKEFCQKETSQIRQGWLRLSAWNTGEDETRRCLMACVTRLAEHL